MKREVSINKDDRDVPEHVLEDAPEDVRTTCAEVVTLDIHEDPTSKIVTIANDDVPRGTVGVFRGVTNEDVKGGVIEDVTRGHIEEATKYAYKDVLGGASIFSCSIW